jgi:hypothetical protein
VSHVEGATHNLWDAVESYGGPLNNGAVHKV